MKLSKHDNYKDIDLPLLDKVPSNWEVKRIKDLVRKIASGVTPTGGSEVYVSSGIPFLRSQNIYDEGLKIDDVSYITVEINQKMKNSQVKPNDILINITGASIGRSCIIPETLKRANINQHMLVLRFKKNSTSYIAKFLKSNYIKEYINSVQSGTSKEALTMRQALNLPLIVPPQKESKIIFDYLNRNINKIEKKIALLKTKIDYYKELRKSIINEAVCKGLDKNVKLKDSGIHYINSVPIHWTVERIKDQFYIGRGRVIGQEALLENGEYPVYSSQTENNGCLGFIATYDFDKDLLTWTTDGANAGTVFRRSGKFNCTNVCGTLIPKRKNVDLNYVVYALQESATHNKRIDTNGAKIMNNEMGVIQIAFPPLSEQTRIANFLDDKTKKIDTIVSNIQKQIETLIELRKTLINDVVTGKLKVTD